METGDPDDVLTLLLLLAHPRVNLKAVTITPGTRSQVALVAWILKELGADESVRLGAQRWPENADKPMPIDKGVGFYASFGRAKDFLCEPAALVLVEACDARTTLLTGGPLHNLGDALEAAPPSWRLGRWVGQGGFAGVGVMDDDKVLPKFAGLKVCQTWNFNGNIAAARAALDSPAISRRVLAAKNVCHRVHYNELLHRLVAAAARSTSGSQARALGLVHGAMAGYLARRGSKKFHDPLAFALCLDEEVCQLREVVVEHVKASKGVRGGWGSSLCQGSGIWISVDYDAARFAETILGVDLDAAAPRDLQAYVDRAAAGEPED